MNLQVMLPKRKCVNKCPFCVVDTHDSPETKDLSVKEFGEKLFEQVVEHGFSTAVITGENEVFQTPEYLVEAINVLHKAGVRIELTTTGVFSFENKKWADAMAKVDVMNISVYTTNDKVNRNLLGYNEKFSQERLVKELGNLKRHHNTTIRYTVLLAGGEKKNFDLLAHPFDELTYKEIIGDNQWIRENKIDRVDIERLEWNCRTYGDKNFEDKYFIVKKPMWGRENVSVFFDYDCQETKTEDGYRYLVFRPNGKLYESWFAMQPIEGEE